MAARILLSGVRAAPLRTFATSTVRRDAVAAAPIPARRPVGALRGGLFGFFFGSTLAGSGVYYYALQDYKASNELLTEDIYALQNAVDRLSKYVGTLEERIESTEKKKKK
ncbi:hypothetical protein OQA88_3823 [Cercophora sp. LCS_1]